MLLFKIWFTVLILGIALYPITYKVFSKFNDRGWIFSKIIGMCLTSWLMWILAYLKILEYSRLNSILIVLFIFVCELLFFVVKYHKKNNSIKDILILLYKKIIDFNFLKNILVSELIFIICLCFWVHVKSFNPTISSTTEQFMDYGYMNSIMNSKYMPAEDIWLSGNPINYYYFGQYVSGFICKLANMNASDGYNYIISLIASFTFLLPFSIAFNLFYRLLLNRINKSKESKKKKKNTKSDYNNKILIVFLSIVVASFAGISTSLGGTLHYPIYRILLSDDTYYFTDEVRYIGYKPEVDDKTATEVPAYSNIVGDLHAHYIDIIFSLTSIALLYEFFIDDSRKSKKYINLFLIAFMLAIQKMTNFWDFPIYIVIISAIIITKELICNKFNKKSVLYTICILAGIFIVQSLVSLPFSLDLIVNSTKVLFTGICSPFYKLLVKWGLPSICAFGFLFYYLFLFFKSNEKFKEFLNNNLTDLFVIIIGICAFGLVLLPEIVYLKDIYGDDFKRFNTMFKLTYQAYILFCISTNYILFRLAFSKYKYLKIVCFVLILINASTFGYGIDTMFQFYKGVKNSKLCQYTTESYISEQLPEDYKAIKWIRDNIQRDKVITEAATLGNSYSTSSRISIFTGNPTVLGWSYHEWIWRSNADYSIPEEITQRNSDLNTLYTSNNKDIANSIIDKYNIDYIYIGEKEYSTYNRINVDLLTSLGKVVYNSGENYLIEVGN